MGVLSALEPAKVFQFFEEICSIPHGSRNVKQISNYLVDFAKERGLKYRQDEEFNVVIWKDGSKGYEDAEPVILQGHMDMVAVKTADCPKDMEKDGLDLEINGDLISAKGTSLGGDDGIAVAYSLAILDDPDMAHPPIEAIFTVDEEIGMLGAAYMDVSDIKGRLFLNMDSEDEGIFTVSCAGGATVTCHLPYERENVAMTAMMGMGVAACDDENDPGTGGSGELTPQEQALKDVIADYVDMTVVPTYKGMADAAMELHSLCIDIRQKKADGTLATADVEAAGEAWKLARDYWEKSEAWLFGPAGDYYVDPHIDSWPLDQIGMDALLNNPAQMAQMDDEGVYVGNYLGYALQGFHAIEYLLFELTNTTADGNATANSTSVAHHLNYTTEELNYLVGLAAVLRNQCFLLVA